MHCGICTAFLWGKFWPRLYKLRVVFLNKGSSKDGFGIHSVMVFLQFYCMDFYHEPLLWFMICKLVEDCIKDVPYILEIHMYLTF